MFPLLQRPIQDADIQPGRRSFWREYCADLDACQDLAALHRVVCGKWRLLTHRAAEVVTAMTREDFEEWQAGRLVERLAAATKGPGVQETWGSPRGDLWVKRFVCLLLPPIFLDLDTSRRAHARRTGEHLTWEQAYRRARESNQIVIDAFGVAQKAQATTVHRAGTA